MGGRFFSVASTIGVEIPFFEIPEGLNTVAVAVL